MMVMRKLLRALAVATLAIAGPTLATAQETPNIVSGQNGEFLAFLALLPMSAGEFQTLWDTPRLAPPDLPSLRSTEVGARLTAVVLTQNLRVTEGRILIDCTITFVTPDGTRQVLKDDPCADTEFTTPRGDLYAFLYFDFDVPDWLAGEQVQIEAEVTDVNATAYVPLRLVLDVADLAGASE